MNNTRPPLVCYAIAAFSLWQSMSLLEFWSSSYVYYGSLAFAIWCLPILLFHFPKVSPLRSYPYALGISALSLCIVVLGGMTSLNALLYVGLSLSLSALVPFSTQMFFWLLCSVSWMPFLGWIGSHYVSQNGMSLIRVLMATLGTICLTSVISFKPIRK